MPQIFHKSSHNPLQDRECEETSLKTYVDDVFPIITAPTNENIVEKVKEQIKRISEYMNMNKLAVNIPKTQIMFISKNN